MKGATARRERNRRELRAQILDAARETVLREGIEALSMRKLAAAVGYSVGSLYLHFEDKQDLLHEVVEASFDELLRALQQIPADQTGIEGLRRKLRVYVDFGLSHPEHYRFIFMMRPAAGERARPAVPHAAFDVLREAVSDCVARGAFRQVDVETASQVLWATIHGITSLLIVRPDFPWVGHDRVIDQVIGTAIDGLRAAADEEV